MATLFLSSFELGKNTKLGEKAKLATSLVSENDLKYLSLVLKNRYNLETIVKFNNNSGIYGGSLYINNSYAFSKIVKQAKGGLETYPSILDQIPRLISNKQYLLLFKARIGLSEYESSSKKECNLLKSSFSGFYGLLLSLGSILTLYSLLMDMNVFQSLVQFSLVPVIPVSSSVVTKAHCGRKLSPS